MCLEFNSNENKEWLTTFRYLIQSKSLKECKFCNMKEFAAIGIVNTAQHRG